MGYRNKSRSNSDEISANPRLTLNIVYRRLEELKPDPANPRRHTKKQIRQLRGTRVLFKTDGDNVKKYFLPHA